MKRLIIYGAGGFGREILDVVHASNKLCKQWDVIGFCDDDPTLKGKTIHGVPVLGNIDEIGDGQEELYFICSVGSPRIRKNIVQKILQRGFKFATIIHPNAILTKYVTLGEGVIVCAGVIMTNEIKIGDHVIINLDVTIGHDTRIEDYCTISPGVHLSGYNSIKQGVDIGTGAVTIQNITIDEWTIIGAGAVVTKNFTNNVTAVGVPAKVIKKNKL